MDINQILEHIADPAARATLAEELADILPGPDETGRVPGFEGPPQNPLAGAQPQTTPPITADLLAQINGLQGPVR